MEKIIPCKECLKYPICQNKMEMQCDDLLDWFAYDDEDITSGDRIAEFEDWGGRDILYLMTTMKKITFKTRRDHYQCLVVKGVI